MIGKMAEMYSLVVGRCSHLLQPLVLAGSGRRGGQQLSLLSNLFLFLR